MVLVVPDTAQVLWAPRRCGEQWGQYCGFQEEPKDQLEARPILRIAKEAYSRYLLRLEKTLVRLATSQCYMWKMIDDEGEANFVKVLTLKQ